MDPHALYVALTAVCPLRGLDIGDPAYRATWVAQFPPDVTAEQETAVQAVLDATAEAAKPVAPPRTATGRQLRYALNAQGSRAAWEAAVSSSKKPDDQDYWTTLGSGDTAPETNPKLARLAAAASPPVDIKALYDAALASN